MRMSVGLTEGDFSVTYACPACRFALAQEDHTALHLCWGWGFDGGDYMYGLETHDYIRYCLENGEAPTETGLEMALAQHRALEDAA